MIAWETVSDYAIRRGDVTISTAYVDGCTLHTVWNAGAIDCVKECPVETMERAAEILKTKSSNGRWALQWLQGFRKQG